METLTSAVGVDKGSAVAEPVHVAEQWTMIRETLKEVMEKEINAFLTKAQLSLSNDLLEFFRTSGVRHINPDKKNDIAMASPIFSQGDLNFTSTSLMQRHRKCFHAEHHQRKCFDHSGRMDQFFSPKVTLVHPLGQSREPSKESSTSAPRDQQPVLRPTSQVGALPIHRHSHDRLDLTGIEHELQLGATVDVPAPSIPIPDGTPNRLPDFREAEFEASGSSIVHIPEQDDEEDARRLQFEQTGSASVVTIPTPMAGASDLKDQGSKTEPAAHTLENCDAPRPKTRRRALESIQDASSSLSEVEGADVRNTLDEQSTTARSRIACHANLQKIVNDEKFDFVIGLAICLDAIVLALQTDYAARSTREELEYPLALRIMSLAFSIVFLLEIACRIAACGQSYFTDVEWRWNMFDLFAVALQATQELLTAVTDSSDHEGLPLIGFGLVRTLPWLRLLRIMRYVRGMRSMLGSVISTFRAFLRTLLILFGIISGVAVYVTQLVAELGHSNPDTVDAGSELYMYYGSVSRSTLTLFQVVTGGVDWRDVTEPLMEHISPLMALLMAMYIAFLVFSILNVITGLFVESAIENSRREGDSDMVQHLRAIFKIMGVPMDGQITWRDFKKAIGNQAMTAYFRSIDLDISEAKGLFTLLDLNDSGSIDAEDFLMGCLRLRGPAKAIDLATLMSDMRQMSVHWAQSLKVLLDQISSMKCAEEVEQRRSRPQTARRSDLVGDTLRLDAEWVLQRQLEVETAPLFARPQQDFDDSTDLPEHEHTGFAGLAKSINKFFDN